MSTTVELVAVKAELAQLRADVGALADKWAEWSRNRSTPRIDAFRDASEQLRELLDAS